MASGESEYTQELSLSELRDDLNNVAFAFRGYNVTNLGRTPELLAHELAGPILREYLQRAAEVCGHIKGRRVDLVARVEQRRETSLATYDEAIALIMAVEMAQLDVLLAMYDVDYRKSKVLFGFSLGEIAALVAGGVFDLEAALSIPIAMSTDAAELADDVTLGVLFSRSGELAQNAVERLCQEINFAGEGVVGVSAYLTPNSVLMIGQGEAFERLASRMSELSTERVYLRRNQHRWPPLHTPIVWQRHIPDRSRHLMHTMADALRPPSPPVFSLVTGGLSYSGSNTRDLIGRWIDHPQRLWEAVDYTLSSGIDAIVHVGPQPNIIPATFKRLAANVESQTKGRIGMRALSNIVRRPWLQALLPRRTALLRADHIRHVNLEDLLLENAAVKTS